MRIWFVAAIDFRSMAEIDWPHFEAVEMRAGTIVKVEDFPTARKPAYIVTVDFGAHGGVRRSSAQITALYSKEELVGRQVMGVLNFPPKQIGPMRSEFLLAGFYREDGAVVLAVPERPVQNGARLG
jgi:tRNA-binding protein